MIPERTTGEKNDKQNTTNAGNAVTVTPRKNLLSCTSSRVPATAGSPRTQTAIKLPHMMPIHMQEEATPNIRLVVRKGIAAC
jgi:hypothetical protein